MYATPLPPPPPPRSNEPYGAVHRRTTDATSTSTASASYYTDTHANNSYAQTQYMASTPSYYASTTTPAMTPTMTPTPPSSLSTKIPSSSQNHLVLLFLIMPLLAMIGQQQHQDSTMLLPVLLCSVLILYSLDLANLKNASLAATWFAVLVATGVNALDLFRNSHSSMLLWVVQVFTETLLFVSWVRVLSILIIHRVW